MELKLGLDIGVTSVGWGIIDENYDIKDCGVRMFPERLAAENAEVRRPMRSSRRRTRRVQHRLHRMAEALVEMLQIDPPEPEGNIYEIRCRGLQEKLSKEDLFLAIMHLAKRRGIHYLTPDDIKDDEADSKKKSSSNQEKSTEEILAEQKELLKNHYVCQVQYAKYQRYQESRSVEDKVRGIENRFTNADYRKELVELLRVQSNYHSMTDASKEKILAIYDSKREYSRGPGSEQSPTPYGCYRYNEQGEVENVNLINKMRGYCTYYPQELRIAASSYTACLFNLLNDLNNLTVQGNPKEDLVVDGKMTEKAKRQLIEGYVNKGKNITIKQLAKYLNVEVADIKGYRVNKKEEAIFTEFKGYFAIRRIYDKLKRENEIHGNRKVCDTIIDILTQEKSLEGRQTELIKAGFDEELANALARAKDITGYHALSLKAIEEILDELWATPNNQWGLFAKAGLFEKKREGLKGEKDIPFDGEDWIVSPVTKRATGEAVKVINEARKWIKKHYGIAEFSDIVIEMACDNNSQQEKEKIQNLQRENEAAKEKAREWLGQTATAGQLEIARYLLEQDKKSAYSGKPVTAQQVLNYELEIEHIIPRSISFDNSQSNKVAAFKSENQKKGQRTPAQYIQSEHGKATYEAFKTRVQSWYDKKDKKKLANLLYEDSPEENMKGFINRNLVDTRYASRKVLELLQEYYKANDLPTRIKTIRGATTHYFRVKANLSKDRNATFAHHAQDALIVAGLSNLDFVRKMSRWAKGFDKNIVIENNRVKNRTTGEVIDNQEFDDSTYLHFVSQIEKANPKYSHKVDRKPNRQLYDTNIKATRTVADAKGNEETYIITKYKNIYNLGMGNSGEKLKKKIQEHPEHLLMYLHDKQTFQLFQEIVDAYPDEKNPFAKYKEEHGVIRKYSRKGNGPEIYDVKFLDGRLGSHRVNTKQNGRNQSVYLSIKSLRIDLYQDGEQYKFVSVPYDMIERIENPKTYTVEYCIKEQDYAEAKARKKISPTARFLYSLHRGEFFSYEKDGERYEWQFWCVNNDRANVIETKWIHKPSPGSTQAKRKITIGKAITNLRKYHVDVLGNRYPAPVETLQMKIEM